DTSRLKKAVRLVDGRIETEASGNVTMSTVRAIAETGVDFISCGALTHSVAALDISLLLDVAPPTAL
ncbi:MAG: nicotinate-nucleotide diphosphorylase (carboxylating), partial [Rhodothermales bacterium]|nr:nicotinate-nucleotide diphosphorylase (carboxylating) [Rhodothermales bacterium]